MSSGYRVCNSLINQMTSRFAPLDMSFCILFLCYLQEVLGQTGGFGKYYSPIDRLHTCVASALCAGQARLTALRMTFKNPRSPARGGPDGPVQARMPPSLTQNSRLKRHKMDVCVCGVGGGWVFDSSRQVVFLTVWGRVLSGLMRSYTVLPPSLFSLSQVRPPYDSS